MVAEPQAPADADVRESARRDDVQVHEHRDAVCADRRRRGDRLHRRSPGIGILVNLVKLLATMYAAVMVFIAVVLLPVALLARVPIRRFVRGGRGADVDCVRDGQLGGGAAAGDGEHGSASACRGRSSRS